MAIKYASFCGKYDTVMYPKFCIVSLFSIFEYKLKETFKKSQVYVPTFLQYICIGGEKIVMNVGKEIYIIEEYGANKIFMNSLKT